MINELWCVVFFSYFFGYYVLGLCDICVIVCVMYYVLLGYGEVMMWFCVKGIDNVGIVLNFEYLNFGNDSFEVVIVVDC